MQKLRALAYVRANASRQNCIHGLEGQFLLRNLRLKGLVLMAISGQASEFEVGAPHIHATEGR